jgi:serine/threonine-protein kinase RsbW
MSTADNSGQALRDLLHLVFPANADGVSSAADAVSETLNQLAVPEQKRLEIGLAVQEALVNAVVHGCANDPTKNVTCHMQSDGDGRIFILVRDPGPGFNPDHLPEPREDENLHREHGRGVYLIRQLMDEVQFEKRGSEIRMWKY